MHKYKTQIPKSIFIILLTIFIPIVYSFSFVPNIENNNELHILSFNTLMAFPEKALSEKNNFSAKFDEEKLTTNEFKKILEFLYLKDYCLVDIYSLIDSENLTINFTPKDFPKDKIPLVLTFDNVTYKSNYQNHGEVDKIIIDRKGNFATYTTKKSIQERIQYDNEFLVILEDFVSRHNDFSWKGAKGVICVSGENGILGYNTNRKNSSSKYEIERASEVVSLLKRKGWNFASNNYKYTLDSNKTDIEFKKEIMLWKSEVASIVGDTKLYSCPKGNFDKTKLDELTSNGFNIILYNSFLDAPQITSNILIIPTKKINGNTLRNNRDDLLKYFDSASIYDTEFRTRSFS